MLAVLLLTIIPTILFSLLLPKIGIKIKSGYLNVAFSWFAGMYLVTFLTFFLAIIYGTFTSSVLVKATFTSLVLCEIGLIFFAKDIHEQIKNFGTIFKKISQPVHVFFIAFCFIFSFAFFYPQLTTVNSNIYRSSIYWDFYWHVGVIQNFAYGDNFPPQNESYAGVPMTYHFFGDLVMAMDESIGASLTGSVTYTSVLFLFFSLIAIIGICEDFFSSRWAGFLAVCLTVTSSSGHVIYYFLQRQGESLSQILSGMLMTTDSAWYLSFIQGSPYNYTGVMFNLFYFVEERHMLITPVFVMLCLWIIYHRVEFSNKLLFILGVLIGGFFYWNTFIALMVALGLLTVFLLLDKRRQTLFLLAGCILAIGLQYENLKHLMQTASYVQGMTSYPKINLQFAFNSKPHSLAEYIRGFVGYYLFAYGIKAILVPISWVIIWRKNKRIAFLLLAFTLPVFIVVNTLQISPSGVGDSSHPMLLLVTFVLDLGVGYLLYLLFIKKELFFKVLSVIFFFLLTVSGIIENAPFINSRPTVYYENYSSNSLTMSIRENTFPKASIVGRDMSQIHLAGRKLFVGPSAGPSLSLNQTPRNAIVYSIYTTKTLSELCRVIGENPIDYVEFAASDFLYPQILNTHLPYFKITDANNNPVIFLETKVACKK